MSAKIPLVQYLFRRLKQYGVHSMHGVPGDFTLKALDHLKPSGIQWIGNCNELNAGYAADGSNFQVGRTKPQPEPKPSSLTPFCY